MRFRGGPWPSLVPAESVNPWLFQKFCGKFHKFVIYNPISPRLKKRAGCCDKTMSTFEIFKGIFINFYIIYLDGSIVYTCQEMSNYIFIL